MRGLFFSLLHEAGIRQQNDVGRLDRFASGPRGTSMAARKVADGRWRPEYTVALIGLAGVVFSNLVTNWDRVFKNTVTIEVADYEATHDLDTEIRLFLDRSGERQSYEDVIATTEDNIRAMLPPDLTNEEANAVARIVAAKLPSFDDYVREVMPIYRKHYTVAELQRLNRIYSSPELRGQIRRQLEVGREANQIFYDLVIKGQQAANAEIAAWRAQRAAEGK